MYKYFISIEYFWKSYIVKTKKETNDNNSKKFKNPPQLILITNLYYTFDLILYFKLGRYHYETLCR